MKKSVKVTAALMAATLCFASMPLSAFAVTKLATQHTTASEQGKSFKEKWNKRITYQYGPSSTASIEYYFTIGYDTFMFKEDYVTACFCPTGYYVQGRVENGCAKSAYTSRKGGMLTGKADVIHFGSNVDYWLYLTSGT